MRNLLNQLLKNATILFVFSVFFISCQEEDEKSSINQSNFNRLEINYKELGDLYQIDLLATQLEKIKNRFDVNHSNSRNAGNDFELQIDTNEIVETIINNILNSSNKCNFFRGLEIRFIFSKERE